MFGLLILRTFPFLWHGTGIGLCGTITVMGRLGGTQVQIERMSMMGVVVVMVRRGWLVVVVVMVKAIGKMMVWMSIRNVTGMVLMMVVVL